MEKSLDPKTQELINILADLIREDVKEIERLPETTKNHYGSYMNILGQWAGNTYNQKLAALAMLEAGANTAGIQAALKALNLIS